MQEAILLQEIDKLRGKAKPNEHDDVVMHNMQQFSQPKLWKLAAGKSVLVETPNTIRLVLNLTTIPEGDHFAGCNTWEYQHADVHGCDTILTLYMEDTRMRNENALCA